MAQTRTPAIGGEPVETYITFGPDHEEASPHPWVLASGYVTIVAANRDAARDLAFLIFGREWAFDYAMRPNPRHHPTGETARISLTLEIKEN